ncbi:MAG: DsbA family protein, partial [Betaproteobacteria bacterium]
KILETNKYTEIVAKEQASAHEMGIQGVPYFIFNEQVGLSGAQPADMIVKAIEHVTKESNLPS